MLKNLTSDKRSSNNVVFISGDNFYLVSEPSPGSVEPPAIRFPLSNHPLIYPHSTCSLFAVRGCVKYVFISGGNPHITNRFCGVVLYVQP